MLRSLLTRSSLFAGLALGLGVLLLELPGDAIVAGGEQGGEAGDAVEQRDDRDRHSSPIGDQPAADQDRAPAGRREGGGGKGGL